jgi:hypothetical protein
MRLILFTILAYFILIGNVFGNETGTFCEDTPSTISKYLRCVYSILPQKLIRPSNGKGFITKGLKPATAFMINNNFLVTAKHTADQSHIAFARNIDVYSNFTSKYKCTRVNSHRQDNDTVTILNYLKETNKLINKTEIKWDVGYYKIKENHLTHFFRIGKNAKVGQDVFLIGILFDKNSGSYSAKYSIGKIEKIIQSTGTAHLYFISAESQEGWSGGPVIDLASGKVLGVISGEYIFSQHRYTIAWSLSGLETLERKDSNK